MNKNTKNHYEDEIMMRSCAICSTEIIEEAIILEELVRGEKKLNIGNVIDVSKNEHTTSWSWQPGWIYSLE